MLISDWSSDVCSSDLLVMAVLIASANYGINEYLDRDFDALHPTKSLRRAVQRQMDGRVVWLLWLTLVVAGVGIALATSKMMPAIALAFAAHFLAFIVPPLRTTFFPFLSLLSYSFYNPLLFPICFSFRFFSLLFSFFF